MKLIYSIYSDLMEWKDNKKKYLNILHKAYVNNNECELDIGFIPEEMFLPIVVNHIKGVEESQYEEEISAIEGGFVIISGKNKIEWQCCAFINDIKEWEKIIKNRSKIWEKIDIGHPWIYYRVNEYNIQFSEYNELNEDNKESLSKLKIKMELSYNDFYRKLQNKTKEVELFKGKLINIINGSNLVSKEIIIKRMLWQY